MRRLIVLLIPVVLACGGDSTTQPTMASVAGTWDLQTVNGVALPYVIFQTGSNKTELVSDVVTAVSTGSYTQVSTIRSTFSGQTTTQSTSNAGSFTLNGTALVFRANDGTGGTGSVSGNTFTLAMNGFAYVYRKR